MGSCSKLNSGSLSIRRTRRSKPCKSQNGSRTIDDSSSISAKLEALKQLIPANNGEIKVDQLFKETADYIVLLKTQVFVLQKLVDFYGSSTDQSLDNQNPL